MTLAMELWHIAEFILFLDYAHCRILIIVFSQEKEIYALNPTVQLLCFVFFLALLLGEHIFFNIFMLQRCPQKHAMYCLHEHQHDCGGDYLSGQHHVISHILAIQVLNIAFK